MKLRRTRLVLPSAFTAGNMFFGFFAMISAFRGELVLASYFIIIGGLLDLIDGKIAKISKTHTQFGAELDSLADIVTFGIAPAVVMYHFLFVDRGEWSWLLVFLFVLAGALRLARFNVEKPGPYKQQFTGLPIPMAGGVLISFIPFAETGIPDILLSSTSQGKFIAVLIVLLSILMVSHVRYPVFPRIDIKSVKGSVILVAILGVLLAMVIYPEFTLFPCGLAYIIWGLAKELFNSLVIDQVTKNDQQNDKPVLLKKREDDKQNSSMDS